MFGIDLGATHSCIAYIDGRGQATVALNVDGNPTTRSVVMFDPEGGYTVGEVARRSSGVAPGRVVALVKRHIGDPNWRFTIDDQQFSAPQVSAMMLDALVGDANRLAGENVEDVVITVPAYFGHAEREATVAAGKISRAERCRPPQRADCCGLGLRVRPQRRRGSRDCPRL